MFTGLYRVFVGSLLALLACCASPAQEPAETPPEGARLVAVEAFPPAVELKHKFDYAQLVLMGQLDTGQQIDVTRMAQCQSTDAPLEVSPRGLIRPTADGQTSLVFTVADQSISIPVTVTGI